MEVWWEGELVDTLEKQADGGVDWTTYNYQVTAGDPSQLGDLSGKLEFRSIGDNDAGGELLDQVSLMVAEDHAPDRRVGEVGGDGLVRDNKITVTLAGEAYKGNPQYAIVVDGKEVTRGEVDWSKDTSGNADRYADEAGSGNDGKLHGGVGDVKNDEVVWKDVSIDYDFTNGMPQKVEVKFLNDAWGGPNKDDDDRNLIVDKITVDGLAIESEGDFTKYGNRDGMERMSWAGTMEFNVSDAYEAHLKDHNSYKAPIGENLVINSSFEEHGKLNHGSWGTFDKIPGWQASSGVIEIQAKQHGGTSGAEEGKAFLELDSHANSSVFQDIMTGQDGKFKLSFSFSAREGGRGGYDVAANNLTEVYWGGEKIATITADQKGWKSYEFELPAGLNENDFTRLEFKSVGISDSFGGLIDDVSVVRTS